LQAKSALAAGWSSHCLTAPHSSNHKGSQMLLCIATSVSQKCNLNNIFYKSKGHFATGKRSLSVFSENFAPPPGSYAPGIQYFIIFTLSNLGESAGTQLSFLTMTIIHHFWASNSR
jgi:hypothetical protein